MNSVPPPLHPLPPREGRFLGVQKMLEINSQTFMCKDLTKDDSAKILERRMAKWEMPRGKDC
jgi:hypothetical protein